MFSALNMFLPWSEFLLNILFAYLQHKHPIHARLFIRTTQASLISLSLSFVLFNDTWSQKGHSASNTAVILVSSYLLRRLLLHLPQEFVWDCTEAQKTIPIIKSKPIPISA